MCDQSTVGQGNPSVPVKAREGEVNSSSIRALLVFIFVPGSVKIFIVYFCKTGANDGWQACCNSSHNCSSSIRFTTAGAGARDVGNPSCSPAPCADAGRPGRRCLQMFHRWHATVARCPIPSRRCQPQAEKKQAQWTSGSPNGRKFWSIYCSERNWISELWLFQRLEEHLCPSELSISGASLRTAPTKRPCRPVSCRPTAGLQSPVAQSWRETDPKWLDFVCICMHLFAIIIYHCFARHSCFAIVLLLLDPHEGEEWEFSDDFVEKIFHHKAIQVASSWTVARQWPLMASFVVFVEFYSVAYCKLLVIKSLPMYHINSFGWFELLLFVCWCFLFFFGMNGYSEDSGFRGMKLGDVCHHPQKLRELDPQSGEVSVDWFWVLTIAYYTQLIYTYIRSHES